MLKYRNDFIVCQDNLAKCPANLEMSYFYQNRNVLLEEKM
jgi:hypothetical protein